ncbi:MAG TPA: FGGY family carbohydrate kinase [Acidimicrobiales bacterium]|nr:FGGY family carbohydrate kinase [Acidimicrobiales bacterium]
MSAVTTALGIDVGTTNVKATLVGADGTIHATASRNLVADIEGDRAELDAEAQWQAVIDAVQECVAAAPDAAAAVVAVGVDSQYSSIVPVDAEGRPVAPMRLWSDRRGTERSFAILGEHEDAFLGFIERHGIPPVGGGLSLGHVLHLQHDCPDVHARTAAYLEPMDHLNARLTGRIAANQATQFMSQLVDNRSLGQTTYDDVLLGWAGVDPSRLPPLLPMDEPVGTVRPDVAAQLGIPSSAVVYAGVNDTQAGSVATDAFRAGRAGLSIGTTSVLVDDIATKEVDLDHEVLSCPGPFTDRYLVFAENGLGGKPLEHVLQNVVATGGFDTLDEVLATVAPGSGGVLFLPWLRGSMAPANDTNMRGGYVNMSLETGRNELVRATCEGVAHNLAWLLPHVEALTGDPIEELLFVGGAARSAGWAQVVADVLGRPVQVPDRPDFAIARATGLLALHRHGVFGRDQLAALAGSGRMHEPDPAAHEVYVRHQPQFEAVFDALRPISAALNE